MKEEEQEEKKEVITINNSENESVCSKRARLASQLTIANEARMPTAFMDR